MATGIFFDLCPVNGWPEDMTPEDMAKINRCISGLLFGKYVEDGE